MSKAESGTRQRPYRTLSVCFLLMAAAFGAVMLSLAHAHRIETLKVVAGAFVTLLSTLLGASVAFAFARMQLREQMDLNAESFRAQREVEAGYQRQELAFSLHREFSSAEMLRARTEASRLLEKHTDLSYGALYESLPEEQTRPLFLVSEFYDRLALAVEHHRVDLALVPQLFGAYFVWWWIDVFEGRLVGSDPIWPESIRLLNLYHWIERNSNPDDFAIWSSRAKAGKRPKQA